MSKEPAKQEQLVSRGLAGRRVQGSGSGTEKGDGGAGSSIRDHWMIECKQTKHEFIRFEYMWWQKLTHDCLQELKRPMCHLQVAGASVFVIDINDWDEMLRLVRHNGYVTVRLPANEKSFRFEAESWNKFRKSRHQSHPGKIPFWCFKLGEHMFVLVDESVFMSVFGAAYG